MIPVKKFDESADFMPTKKDGERNKALDLGLVKRVLKYLSQQGKDTLKDHVMELIRLDGMEKTAGILRRKFPKLIDMVQDGQYKGRGPTPPAPPKQVAPPPSKRVHKMGETVAPDARSNQIGETLWRESVQIASTIPIVVDAHSSASAINETARDIYKWAQANNIQHVKNDPQVAVMFCDTYLDYLHG